MKLKIAVVVHGRFHAFDLARELINQGHNVVLFTNYPKHIVAKFGIPHQYVKTFILHGIISRIVDKSHQVFNTPHLEPLLHSFFSQWAAQSINADFFDIIHVFSGIAEEIFIKLNNNNNNNILRTLVRGSAHIRVQQQILIEEEQRSGIVSDRVSDWIVEREEREIKLADLAIVLSSFAAKSFLEQGVDPNTIRILPLGSQLSLFRPRSEIIEERCRRILSGSPLRVQMVGTFSTRKGIIDFIQIAHKASQFCKFQFVGSVNPESEVLISEACEFIEFIPRQPQLKLPEIYAWGDIFIFTTLEDGYAVVLAQAQAAGLPILATTNSAAPDLVTENETGWILPIRSPDAFIERLQWCHEHREELAVMVRKVYQEFQPRDWTDVAKDFTEICVDYINQRKVLADDRSK